jgi:CRP/FNR family transcriptional regulator, cyclic AMP receptor protein
MTVAEILGYVASGLVLATFTMRTMVPLRILGISSNIAFIAYGFIAGVMPVMWLHAILLPLNIYRFIEMRRLIREVQEASDDKGDLAWLLPYMRPISLAANTTLFKKGDRADAMYILTQGRIRLSEFNIDAEAGTILGEIGVFSPHGKRMATAICVEECRLQRITRDRVHELVLQNPRFAFYLIGVVTSRLVEDLRIVEQRVSAPSEIRT